MENTIDIIDFSISFDNCQTTIKDDINGLIYLYNSEILYSYGPDYTARFYELLEQHYIDLRDGKAVKGIEID